MQRRRFLRVAGGGAIVAATAGLAGCDSAPPVAAIAAWHGPGAEPDPRRWALAHAILAPHSHNLQSWLVDLGTPGSIVLRCDRGRLLPETDPFGRQIVMSHGTFLEVLDLAARERGLRSAIEPFPDGAFDAGRIDDRPVARIRLVPDASVTRDPLFAQVLRRRTHRGAYEARPVPAAAWAAIADAARADGLRFGFEANAPALPAHRAIAADAWRIELTTPRTILESYRWLRIGRDEVERHRDGLTILDPKLVLLDRAGLFDRTTAPAPDAWATRSQLDDFGRKLESTPAFLWLLSDRNDRASQLAAGRAYVRAQLAATAHGVVMQPLQQALQEYPEQAAPHAAVRRLLGAAPTQTVQMWARVGFADPVPPAPRRGLQAHLVRG